MDTSTVRAVEMAEKAGVDPKVFRSALRKARLSWHGHYDRWEVPKGSVDHARMQDVLDSLKHQTYRKTHGYDGSQEHASGSLRVSNANVDVTTDWFWEGNVVNALAESLAEKGWRIESKANTRTKEQGVDISASREGRTLFVEVKGYPSTTYRDPRLAGERKSTNPTNQAEKWYSHALLKAVRLQTKYPRASVALAFPDFPRYQTLFDETKLGLEKLGVAVLFVNAAGEVREWRLD